MDHSVAAVAPGPAMMTSALRVAFVLSSPRSGSTLLRVMFAGHPSILAPPELSLQLLDRLQREPEPACGVPPLFHDAHLALRRRALIQTLMHVGYRDVEQEVRRWEGERLEIPVVYDRLLSVSRRHLFLDKSPAHTRDVRILARAEAMFDRARYVHLVRHPGAVISSFVDRGFHRVLDSDADPRRLAEEVWAVTNANAIDFLDRVPRQRWLRVRYEELVADPAATAATISTFLSIGWSPAVLDPYAPGRMADGVGDPHLIERDRIDPSLASGWRERSSPLALGPRALRVARELGYDDVNPAQPDRPVITLPRGW